MSQDPSILELRQQQLKLKKRQLSYLAARGSLLRYLELQMPDPEDPENSDRTKYIASPQARILCQIMEKVERGEMQRVAVSIGPQMGKTQIISRGFPAWAAGRDPSRHFILGSYNQTFAEELGNDVSGMVQSAAHRAIFPNHEEIKSAASLHVTTKGGKSAFVGVGGSGSGKPADYFVVDDPIKSAEEANSETYRDMVWRWYNGIVFARARNRTAIVIVHCLTGDTRITMADGSDRRIAEIAPGDKVLSWGGSAFVAQEVGAVIDNGPDQTYFVRTKNTDVRANARHPFLVFTEEGLRWVRTKDLRPGMRIAAYAKAKEKEKSVLSTTARNRSRAEGCAGLITRKPNGPPAPGRLRTALRSGWRTVAGGVTGLLPQNSSVCWPSRAACARFVAPTAASASPAIGSQISSPTITTKQGRFAGCCVTTATESPAELAIPKFWNEPSNTCELDTDEVVSVTPHGVERVYDLTIDGTHNFIANGLLTHNTRWHEDDLIGRLCDPAHPERNKKYAGIADKWTYINIPAVVDDPKLAAELGLTLEVQTEPTVVKQFGTKPIAALYPEEKDLPLLAEAKLSDPRVFEALYMGHPAREDGEYFKANMITEYDMGDLPPLSELKIYGASDHAVTSKQTNDPNVLGCVGVDENEDIWVLPDVVWDHMQTDRTVEELLLQFKAHKPQLWWMESELISKSFGPFLHKRMLEEKVYVTICPVVPSKDKQTRARAIQGRMSMGKVKFPRFAPWYSDARRQILSFPYGAHDDFVDWLAHIGMGLVSARGAVRAPANDDSEPATGTIQWIMRSALARARAEKRVSANRGW